MSRHGKPFLGLEGSALSWAISLCSASAFLLFGYDQGIMGSIISTPYFLEAVSISVGISFDSSQNMVLTSLQRRPMPTPSPPLFPYTMSGAWSDVLSLQFGASSYSVAQLIVGRIVSGIGNGMNTGTVPTWVSETSKAKHRGQLVATQLSIAAFGIVIAYWMNYGFFHLTGQVVWRFPVAFQAAFAIPTIFGLFWLPESPRWLYSKNRNEEADLVMSALKGLPIEHEVIQAERSEILAAIALEDHFGEYSLKTIFYDRSGQKIPQRMALVFIIQMIQQLPGVNIVIYYSSTVFLQLGISANLSLVLGGVASISFWVGSLFGIALIERVGRKKLLVSGTIPILIGYCIYTPMVKNGGTAQLWVAFGATCLICVAFGWSWLPTPWCLGPELVPVRYRHIGNALNAFANWTFTFIIVKVGPIGIANIHWRLYIVFIIFTFLQLPIVWFLYPETRGLTLEEIDTVFVKDHAVTDALAEKAEHVRHLESKHVDVTSIDAA
ncbi:putative Sugar transporter [Fonsecaea pedrosoi]|nr:putative Sugar transporter [Fonsecaea pedrosoi]